MTNKWQCSKCKKTAVIDIVDKAQEREKLKCCFRIMRNLSEEAYTTEKTIEESGIRKD